METSMLAIWSIHRDKFRSSARNQEQRTQRKWLWRKASFIKEVNIKPSLERWMSRRGACEKRESEKVKSLLSSRSGGSGVGVRRKWICLFNKYFLSIYYVSWVVFSIRDANINKAPSLFLGRSRSFGEINWLTNVCSNLGRCYDGGTTSCYSSQISNPD